MIGTRYTRGGIHPAQFTSQSQGWVREGQWFTLPFTGEDPTQLCCRFSCLVKWTWNWNFYLLYTPCYQLACIHTCFVCLHVCEIKAYISPFLCAFVCVHDAYTVNRLWVCLKEWGMSVCLYVWVCVSLVFPGLNSRVALGAESPGCNTLIVELFTLYSNPLHPHFGRVPLPLA